MNRKKKNIRKRILAWALAAGMVISGYSGNGFVMPAFATAETVKFGNNDAFTYTIENNKLTITGKGEMPDFDSDSAPWKSILSSSDCTIEVIEIGEGITSVGKNAFNASSDTSTDDTGTGGTSESTASTSGNISVSEVILPTTLTGIKNKAFANLKSLDTLIIGSSVTPESDAFSGSKSPANLCYLGEDSCPESFGGMTLAATDAAIAITKHYYDSDGNAESSTVTDKFVPASMVEGTLYEGTKYDITKFPYSEEDKEYTWYTTEGMTGDVFEYKNITSSTKFNLYGKKNAATASPSETTTETPSASPSTTPTVSPDETETPSPTVTPSPTAEPSPTVTPSPTAEPSPTVTPSPTASPSTSVTPTKDPVSPKQQPVIGNVTCEGTVSPATSYDKVTLTRTDTTVPGTLKLKPTDFSKSGSNQCEYVFTPTDTSKYSEVTGKVSVNVEKDTLTSITTDGALQKGTYKYGDSFDISGLKVIANFQSGNSKDVTDYVKATELKVGTTSVDISYTFDSVTKKITYNGFVVEKGDIPSGEPNDTEVENTIKTVSAAATAVLGTGSKWQFDSSKSSTVIPAGGSLDVEATYKGSDASSYTTITKTVKISRKACTEGDKILYTGTGEKAPTCTEAGVGHTVCSKCGDVVKSNIAVEALGHSIEYVAAKSATCTEKGNDAYYKCKNCGKTYSDTAGKTETTVKSYDALGHKFDGQTPTYTWSSDHKSCVASIACKVCNDKVTETAESVCTTLQEATCQSLGEALYMAEFKNSAFSVQFEYGKLSKTSHFLKKIERVEATDTTEGNIEYYECTVCNKMFYDSTGLVEITDKSSIVIPVNTVTPTPQPEETASPSETTKPSQATPKPVGTSVRDTSGAIYRVTSSDEKNPTVEYKKTTAVVGGKVKIKSSVKVLGITYKITAIAANTFKNNKKITSVTVGNNVTSIGKSAFEKCTKLKSVTLSKNVEDIGKNAFKNCKNLNTITIKSTKLDAQGVKKGAFSGINKKVVVKVPKSKYSAYKKLLKAKGLNTKVKIKKI